MPTSHDSLEQRIVSLEQDQNPDHTLMSGDYWVLALTTLVLPIVLMVWGWSL